MPTPNVELLQKTLAHIKANPNQWDQDFYRRWSPTTECGTAMCFAGWSATLAGGEWIFTLDLTGGGDYLTATDEDDPRYVHDGVVHAANRARRILGLTDEQKDNLFHPNNSLRDLENLVAELCAEAAQGTLLDVDHVEAKPVGR